MWQNDLYLNGQATSKLGASASGSPSPPPVSSSTASNNSSSSSSSIAMQSNSSSSTPSPHLMASNANATSSASNSYNYFGSTNANPGYFNGFKQTPVPSTNQLRSTTTGVIGSGSAYNSLNSGLNLQYGASSSANNMMNSFSFASLGVNSNASNSSSTMQQQAAVSSLLPNPIMRQPNVASANKSNQNISSSAGSNAFGRHSNYE